MRIRIGWCVGLTMVVATVATAEVRTWNDASGKFSVEAEMLSVQDRKVVLKAATGKEVSVPLARLSDADRDYVKAKLTDSDPAEATGGGDPTAKSAGDAALMKRIRGMAETFFKDLRGKERTAAAAMLTEAARSLVKDGKSPLAALPTPDKGSKGVKVGAPAIDGTVAEVPVQVRVGGNVQKLSLHLRNDADEWRVFAISAKFGDDEKTLNFEASAAPAANQQDPLAALVGQEVDVTGVTPDGKSVSLADFRGKVVLLDFWATWCGPCRAEMPNIRANWDKYHQRGFEVIAISVDTDLNALAAYVGEEKPPWTVVADNHPMNRNSMAAKFQIRGIPAFVLIGKDGRVAAVQCRGPRLGMQLSQLLGG